MARIDIGDLLHLLRPVRRGPSRKCDKKAAEIKRLRAERDTLLETQRKFGTMMHEVMDERDAALQERDLAEHRQGEAMAERDELLAVIKGIARSREIARKLNQPWCPAAEGMVRQAKATLAKVGENDAA